jgi:hypothetical protein
MDPKEVKQRFEVKNYSFLLNTKMGADLLFCRDPVTVEEILPIFYKWKFLGKGEIFLTLLEKYCSKTLHIPKAT